MLTRAGKDWIGDGDFTVHGAFVINSVDGCVSIQFRVLFICHQMAGGGG